MTAAVAVPNVSLWKSAEIATLFPNAQIAIDRTTIPAFVGGGSALEKVEGTGLWKGMHIRELDTATNSCLKRSVQPAFHNDRYPAWLAIVGCTVRQVDNDTRNSKDMLLGSLLKDDSGSHRRITT